MKSPYLERLKHLTERYELEARLMSVPVVMGHRFDPLTSSCECGMTMREMEDTKPNRRKTHDDFLNPGTIAATHRNRATGRVIHYRKRVRNGQ